MCRRGRLKSVAEPQDSLLRRAFPRRRFLLGLGETVADLSRRWRIIDPAGTESGQAQVDFTPFGLALRLQGGKFMDKGSRKPHKVTHGYLMVVILSDQECVH